MFEIFKKTEKLPGDIKQLLKPRKEFTEQTRTAFLTVFDAAHPGARGVHSFTAVAKTFIAGGALVAIFAGVSVYADTANVPADSTLYPLKRLSENVQLALAPMAEKPELQAKFASRRADEISDLEARKPSSTIIASLDNDFDSDVSSSISSAIATNLDDGQLNSFCGKVLSAIATSSVAMHDHLSIRAGVFAHFERECVAGDNAAATSTTTKDTSISTGTAAGSASSSPFFTFPNLGQGFGHSGSSDATSTTISASTTVGVSTTLHVRGGGFLDVILNEPRPASSTPGNGGQHSGGLLRPFDR